MDSRFRGNDEAAERVSFRDQSAIFVCDLCDLFAPFAFKHCSQNQSYPRLPHKGQSLI